MTLCTHPNHQAGLAELSGLLAIRKLALVVVLRSIHSLRMQVVAEEQTDQMVGDEVEVESDALLVGLQTSEELVEEEALVVQGIGTNLAEGEQIEGTEGGEQRRMGLEVVSMAQLVPP